MLVGLGVALATVALHLRDPHEHTWSFWFLPFWGPGCGGLRAVNDLSNLRIVEAASSNLLFVASVPFLVGGWAWWLWRAWRGNNTRLSVDATLRLVLAVAALALVFTALRNLPAGAWLAP